MHVIDTTSCVDFTSQNKTKAKGKNLACVAGVNGEGEGEQERWRRGTGGQNPIFLPRSRSPYPFPVYACYAG